MVGSGFTERVSWGTAPAARLIARALLEPDARTRYGPSARPIERYRKWINGCDGGCAGSGHSSRLPKRASYLPLLDQKLLRTSGSQTSAPNPAQNDQRPHDADGQEHAEGNPRHCAHLLAEGSKPLDQRFHSFLRLNARTQPRGAKGVQHETET